MVAIVVLSNASINSITNHKSLPHVIFNKRGAHAIKRGGNKLERLSLTNTFNYVAYSKLRLKFKIFGLSTIRSITLD
jgi:hypothetical protein